MYHEIYAAKGQMQLKHS